MALEPGGIEDRIAGALLGTFVGDAACAPFEGADADPGRLVVPPGPGEWRYTDDTQLAMALAEHLVEHDRVEPESLARTFLEHYEPERGYGAGTREVFRRWQEGAGLVETAQQVFPQGSFGNGAAMRSAPVGARFHEDTARVGEEARKAASLTHAHPAGVDGAVVLALAVAMAVREGAFGPGAVIELARGPWETELSHGLAKAADLARTGVDDVAMVVEELGHEVTAQRSVPTALWAAALSTDLPETASRCARLGGDTDTIGAMSCAVVGAAMGLSSIPRDWLDALEDGERGRSYALELADRLARTTVRA